MIKKYIKYINNLGNICIPKKIREQMPSSLFEIKVMSIEVEPGKVKDCIVLEPKGNSKKSKVIYE